MHMIGCVCGWNFGTKFFLRGEECETPENPRLWIKGKIVISAEKSRIFLNLG